MARTHDSPWGSDFTHMVVRRSAIADRPERTPSPAPRRPAPIGLRIGAAVIDAVIMAATIALPLWYLRTRLPSEASYCASLSDRLVGCRKYASKDLLYLRQAALVVVFAVVLTAWLVPLGRSGRTLGRWLLGIRVVDLSTGAPIGYIRAVLRTLFELFSIAALGIGFLSSRFNRDSQTWHDMLTHSVSIAEELPSRA